MCRAGPGCLHSLVFPNIRSHREITADRRHKETEALQEIGRNLPLSKSQVERSNQSSLLRLAINFIKARELMATAGLDSGELTTRDEHELCVCVYNIVMEGFSCAV